MTAHEAAPGQIRKVAIDMSKTHIKGVAEHLRRADICFDCFHIM